MAKPLTVGCCINTDIVDEHINRLVITDVDATHHFIDVIRACECRGGVLMRVNAEQTDNISRLWKKYAARAEKTSTAIQLVNASGDWLNARGCVIAHTDGSCAFMHPGSEPMVLMPSAVDYEHNLYHFDCPAVGAAGPMLGLAEARARVAPVFETAGIVLTNKNTRTFMPDEYDRLRERGFSKRLATLAKKRDDARAMALSALFHAHLLGPSMRIETLI